MGWRLDVERFASILRVPCSAAWKKGLSNGFDSSHVRPWVDLSFATGDYELHGKKTHVDWHPGVNFWIKSLDLISFWMTEKTMVGNVLFAQRYG